MFDFGITKVQKLTEGAWKWQATFKCGHSVILGYACNDWMFLNKVLRIYLVSQGARECVDCFGSIPITPTKANQRRLN